MQILMPLDFYALVIPFCTIPAFLVSLDYLNRNDKIDRKKQNIIDFDKYIKNKEEGDAIDADIAELLDIDKIVA